MNIKNPAIKRIIADVRELEKHPSSRYAAAPLEDNLFEWHFTIRGPQGSDFEGGIYHGRILLSSDYPFKPPNIVFMTKNGRFEVGTKICLSISAHHEESWQPAWGVRTMLEAIISFLPSEGAGAIGALDWTRDERQRLARESQAYCCPTCGRVAELLVSPEEFQDEQPNGEIAAQITQLRMQAAKESTSTSSTEDKLAAVDEFGSSTPTAAGGGGQISSQQHVPLHASPLEAATLPPSQVSQVPSSSSSAAGHGATDSLPPVHAPAPAPNHDDERARAGAELRQQGHAIRQPPLPRPQQRDLIDDLLTVVLILLGSLILFLLSRRLLSHPSSSGGDAHGDL